MATLSDFYYGNPMDFGPLSQYPLGYGAGATRFNQNYRPTTRFMSRGRGPESLYLNNMGVFAPTQMGDFAPSAGLMGEMQPLSAQQQVQAAPQTELPELSEPPLETMEQVFGDQQPRRTLGLLGDMFGGASALDEYLTPQQKAQLQDQGLMAAAMQLLAASGPSRTPVGLGQALGQAYGAGQQGYTAAQQNLLQSMAAKQKMDEAKREVAAQAAYQRDIMGGGQVGAQPAGVVTAPPGQVAAVDLGITPTGTPAAAMPTGFASLTQEQRMILSRLPAKEGYKEALRLMEPKPDTSPDDIKKLRALGLDVTLKNLQLLNPEGTPIEIRLLKSLGITPTLENVFKLRQSSAAQQNVRVDTGDKTRAVEINKDIVADMRSLTDQARTANQTLANVDRVLPALDRAITGPMADYRTTLLRVGEFMGIAGKDANEILSNTQSVVQGLAQQELNAASYTKGQGTLTGPEREMLKRSAAGDQNMSAAELRTALIAAQKMAQFRINEQQEFLTKFSALPGSEQYVPFYTIKPYQSSAPPEAAGVAGRPPLSSIIKPRGAR